MTAASFELAKAGPEGRRQVANEAAREQFATLREVQLATWRVEKDAASLRLEAAKAATAELPETAPADPKEAEAWASAHAEFAAASAAYAKLEQQPSPRPLLAQLDAAGRAADATYKSEVRALAAQHGVKTEG